MGIKTPKSPVPHGDPYRHHHLLAQPHSAPKTAARSLHMFSHSNATNSLLLTIYNPKLLLSMGRSLSLFAVHILGPTIPNGIQIQSAVFFTIHRTDTHTDLQEKVYTENGHSNNRPLALYRTERRGLIMRRIVST